MRAFLANGVEVEPGPARPVFADDLEPRARYASGHFIERLDQSIDSAALKNRTHEKHQRLSSGSGLPAPGSRPAFARVASFGAVPP